MRSHPVPNSAIDCVGMAPVTYLSFLSVNQTDEIAWAGRGKLLSPLWTGQWPSRKGVAMATPHLWETGPVLV